MVNAKSSELFDKFGSKGLRIDMKPEKDKVRLEINQCLDCKEWKSQEIYGL